MKARILLLFLCIFTVVTWAQIPTQPCSTCGKVLSTCSYKGKHPTCKECGKLLEKSYTNSCPHGGNHPCSQCKKPNCSTKNSHKVCKDCQAYDFQCRYGLKHPICNTCSLTIESNVNSCSHNGKHPVCRECDKLLEKAYTNSCAYEGVHPNCDICKQIIGTGKSNACKHNGEHPRCECGKLIEQQYGNACPYEGKHPVCDNCKKVIGLGTDASCQYDGKHFVDGHEWVDLGLPSGTLWATCNIGASTPYEPGSQFAWGEVNKIPKSHFDWNSYQYNDKKGKVRLTKYCTNNDLGTIDNKTELELEDDAAFQLWGRSWRLPSQSQLEELLENCVCVYSIQHGKQGLLVKSKTNDSSIFLPNADSFIGDNQYFTADYWSRSLTTSSAKYTDRAVALTFNNPVSRTPEINSRERCCGLVIRPVCTSANGPQAVQEKARVLGTLDFTVKDVKFTMRLVEAGTFIMGATSEQIDAKDNEKPAHEVTLTNDYYLGETEVTQALWKAVMGREPKVVTHRDKFGWAKTLGKGAKYPAYYISWNEAHEFLRKLNQITGLAFRLPTEAEWEYAARGGKYHSNEVYSGSNEIDDVAWHRDNSEHSTHPVGRKLPNSLFLYDMSGNVCEWCEDVYSDDYYSYSESQDPVFARKAKSDTRHVLRGGGRQLNKSYCRTSSRFGHQPIDDVVGQDVGFRLALTVLH